MRSFYPVRIVVLFIAALALHAHGLAILSGPTFTPATNAPLAGVLQIDTDANSTIGVVVNDGTNTWERDFDDLGTTHSEILLGFKPGRTNSISVIVYDQDGDIATSAEPVLFVTK